ncbi:capsular polysaccharide export protein, LipB/KpsS family, partial [Campylobacter coli]|uniref:capsular polysaccharide export protein, LipB/KpsS family n=1 Tax=Campylobacter coli TaxID=195 RepID=UPI003F693F89
CNTNKKIILIPAQVEDDASLILGGAGFDTLKLLQSVRAANKDAFIVFKSHPDVLSGNRKVLKDNDIILKYCDEIIENVSID